MRRRRGGWQQRRSSGCLATLFLALAAFLGELVRGMFRDVGR